MLIASLSPQLSESLPQALGDLDTTLLWCPILLTSLKTLLPPRLRKWSGYELKNQEQAIYVKEHGKSRLSGRS